MDGMWQSDMDTDIKLSGVTQDVPNKSDLKGDP